MSILKVARMGHPVLRKAAKALVPTEIRTPQFQKLIDDMIETMHEYVGIGLAGPQVHESVRLFVAGIEADRRSRLQRCSCPFINPEITPVGTARRRGLGGLPEHSRHPRPGRPRPATSSIRALDRRGKPFEMDADRGYPARVVQHEADHLDGVLFLDRMKSFESLTLPRGVFPLLVAERDEDE